MRLFILGATGLTGRQLVTQALARGHDVTAFARAPEKLSPTPAGLTVCRGDPRVELRHQACHSVGAKDFDAPETVDAVGERGAPGDLRLGPEVAGGSYDASIDEQTQVAELAVHRAKRTVEQGRDAVVVIDSLDALPAAAARRTFGAGRNTDEAGSLTVLASTGTVAEAHRMATTHVTLEPNELQRTDIFG